MTNDTQTYETLEDLQAKKDELLLKIRKSNEDISRQWKGLFVTKKANTRGELITSIICKSITAFDAFMLARKMVRQYGHMFGHKKI